jgi:hypothetical protein
LITIPSGIAIDTENNIVFISDIFTNIIYAVTPTKWTVIAGSGLAGYSGDNAQAVYAKLDGPFFLQYYNGALYIADKNNKCIRKIDFQSTGSATILTTTTNPTVFTTTTIPATSSTASTSTAIITRPSLNELYTQNINLPSISQVYNSNSANPMCCYITQPNYTVGLSQGKMLIYTNQKLYISQYNISSTSFLTFLDYDFGNVTSMTSDAYSNGGFANLYLAFR